MRDILKALIPLLGALTLPAAAAEPVVGLPCEGCDAVYEGMPKELPIRGRIAPRGEPGEPMVLTGRVLGPDGRPRADVVVYAYQTDAQGVYPAPAKSLSRWADRHGRLRGWVRSSADGTYTFDTIRPASYPGQKVPQHIHVHVIERGCATYYIDEVIFTDDPFLTAEERQEQPGRGGSGVTTPRRDTASDAWQVVRDIYLGKGIPGYPGCKGA
jgi:protocatechuate 3,4-dioxygenase beta subunit